MSSYRLKNIIICILLFVNVALLLLAANNLYRQNQQQQNLEEQVLELYAGSGITLSVNQIAAPQRMYSLSLLRDSEEEMLFAATILGDELTITEQSSGTFLYQSELGEGRFRQNGYFDIQLQGDPVSDPMSLCQRICQRYGYRQLRQIDPQGGKSRYTADLVHEQLPIYRCAVTFAFDSENRLTEVSGYFLPEEGSRLESINSTVASALVQFLDYRNRNGIVCNEVLSVSPGYFLQPGSSNHLQLVPVWSIETDTHNYYVNVLEQTVSLAS